MALSKESKEKLDQILIDVFDVNEKELTLDSEFKDDLGMDSLDYVEFIMEVEKEFDVNLPDQEVEGLKLYGQFVLVLIKHLGDA